MSNKTILKSINSISPKQKITAKQYEFARLVAEEHLTSSDAYRKAYKPNILAKNKSIHEMACRVMTNIKVQSMIRSIQHKREEENKVEKLVIALEQLTNSSLNQNYKKRSKMKCKFVNIWIDRIQRLPLFRKYCFRGKYLVRNT